MWKLSKRLINERKTISSAVAGTNRLQSRRIRPGRLLKTKIVVIENQTNAYTKLRVGIYDRGFFYNFFEEMLPLAAQLYWVTDEMILCEGQQVQAELFGCTAGDSLEMFVHGSWLFETL